MKNFLFGKVGKKCKAIAFIVFMASAIITFVFGLILLCTVRYSAIIAVPMMLLGPVLSWLCSLSLYAIGEAADKSAQAVEINEDIKRRMGNR